MQVPAIQGWGEAMLTSIAAALALLMAAVPKVIGFLLILLVGWFIAGLIAKAVGAILRNVRFNDFARRSGLGDFVDQMGVQTDPAGVLAATVKWFVRLLVLIVAFDALGLPAVSQVLNQLLLWMPNLVVALVVLVIAGLAANALHSLVRGATAKAGFSSPDLFANIAYVSVWVFGVVVAVNQVGIAGTLVNTLFMGFIGALALALGLSFGLGARETAGQIVSDWYDEMRRSKGKVAAAANIARDDASAASRSIREELRPPDDRGARRPVVRPNDSDRERH